jgi:murein DD-endopeptidase MepM/ murein hydrolase activator NlpD
VRLSSSIVRWISFAVVSTVLAVPASALANDGATGGASVPDEPSVVDAVCEDGIPWECARGTKLILSGASLAEVESVRFLGRRGRRDDRVAPPRDATDTSLQVVVPSDARTGKIAVVNGVGETVTSQRLTITRGAAPRSAIAPGLGVFPIAGPHKYGTGTNHFGGGRGHQGEDVFAKCGTPLVAVYDATVQHKAFQSRAGNYVVLQASNGESFAYMHMQSPTPLKRGDLVAAGDPVGKVGDTGRASGCHLHFEHWTAPGWYEGGEAIDPLPLLKSLDRR